MKQDKLIERYKEKTANETERYYQPSKYFNKTIEFYKDLQEGIASEINFFENTMTVFKQVAKPRRKPDYESDSGSRYWYSKKGLIRGSDHWGNGVANCDWPLKTFSGKMIYGSSWKSPKSFKTEQFGFSKWEDFVFKAKLFEINNHEIVSSFKNVKGKDLIEVDKKRYLRKVIEVFEEV